MARGNPDLDDYCRCSWYLCKKGDEIKKLLEEMKNATADVWYDKYQEYTRIMESMEDVMHRVEYMNEMFKELYKYNEDLYNRTMCGAYYEKGEKITTGRPQDYRYLGGFKIRDTSEDI